MKPPDGTEAGRIDLLGLERPELEGIVRRLGERPFRAGQIYRWLYARGARSIEMMTDLPLSFREALAREFTVGRPAIRQVQDSFDGTRKYLLELGSGGAVESVFMPEPRRVTFCISPQIGCALDCRFCLTARMGFVRNLDAGGIVGQVLALREDNRARIEDHPINVVMMGMGEPLHNYDSAVRSIRLMTDEAGLAIPRRRVTLSTAGWASGIRRLSREPVRPRLAVSLNATTDAVRSRLMPVNRKFPLDELLEACRLYPLAPRERLTFEYVLLAGVNDTPRDPPRLAALMNRHGLRAKVNLIPFNPCGEIPYREPTPESVRRFRDDLLSLGVPASIRRNRGRDISAACGQLALSPTPTPSAQPDPAHKV